TTNKDIDLFYNGTSGADRVTFNQLKAPNGIKPASAFNRAGVAIFNSNVGEDQLGIIYNDLPGNSGVVNPSTRVEGEEHLIVDAAAANCSNPITSPAVTYAQPCPVG